MQASKLLRATEVRMLALAQRCLAKCSSLRDFMRALACEIQLDKKKLILYCEMPKWLRFNGLVNALAKIAGRELGVAVRVFIQRKCAFKCRAVLTGALHRCVSAWMVAWPR